MINKIILGVLLTMAGAGALPGAIVSVTPQAGTVSAGDFTVTVGLSGFGGSEGAVSGVSFDLNYDPTLVSFTGGSTFGDPSLTPTNQLALTTAGVGDASLASPGDVSVYYVSFDAPSDLTNLQASSFEFASFEFSTVGPGGTSALTLGNLLVLDENANDITSTVTVQNGAVTVNSTPEPGTWGMMLAAGIGWMGARARRRLAGGNTGN